MMQYNRLWLGLTAILQTLCLGAFHTCPPSQKELHPKLRGSLQTQCWMQNSWSRLKDTTIHDLVIPGTLGSASFSVASGYTLSPIQKLLVSLGFGGHKGERARLQKADLMEQLTAGARYLDLEIVTSGEELLWHSGGIAGDNILQGMRDISVFAQRNPKELIFVSLAFVHPKSGYSCEADLEPECDTYGGKLLVESLGMILDATLGPFILPVAKIRGNYTLGNVLNNNGRNIIALSHQRYLFPARYNGNIVEISKLQDAQNKMSVHGSKSWSSGEGCKEDELHTVLGNFRILKHSTGISHVGGFYTLSGASDFHTVGFMCLFIFVYFCIFIWIAWKTGDREIVKRNCKRKLYVCFVFAIVYQLASTLFHGKTLKTATQYTPSGNIEEHATSQSENDKVNDLVQCKNRFQNLCDPKLRVLFHTMQSKVRDFKFNIVLVDHFFLSCTIYETIAFNLGLIPREIDLSHKGAPFPTHGLSDFLFPCPTLPVAYVIMSRDEGSVITWSKLSPGSKVTLQEGQYPMDALMLISVGTGSGIWRHLYSGNLQQWIEKNLDLFIRGTEDKYGRGYAYISDQSDLYSTGCAGTMPSGYLNATTWNMDHVTIMPHYS